jgi:predicted amidophosphoribosyltransferase
MRLNEKGQCPACKKKARPYRREHMLFCCRCHRQYSEVTHEQEENWAWHRNISGEWVPLSVDAKKSQPEINED